MKGMLIANLDINVNSISCHSFDKLLFLDANVFNFSGDIQVVINTEGRNHHFPLDESAIVAEFHFVEDTENIDISLYAILCQRKDINDIILRILTVVCNSISLVFLFLTIVISLTFKSFKSMGASTIPHLATSLFLAQLLLQVSPVNFYLPRPGGLAQW